MKSSDRIRDEDLKGLRAFGTDYPEAKYRLIYTGERRYFEGGIEIIPATAAFQELEEWIKPHPPRTE